MSVEQRSEKRLEAPPASTSAAARSELIHRFDDVRATTESLCEGLSPEDGSAQSMPEASPIKWHLAHASWFFETFVLAPNVRGDRAFHPEFSYLFNSYYNAVGERVARAQRGLITRPDLGEVRAYRRHVDQRVREHLGSARALEQAVIELGCHHEQQHQELMLTDLKHLLSLNPLEPSYRARTGRSISARSASPLSSSSSSRFLAFDEGLHWIGHAGGSFAFDNEMPRHRAFVGAFELASRPVTNGEYLEFIADRGYERPELWLSDGWDVARSQGWRAPLYWTERDGGWQQFTLSGSHPLDPHEPVCHVSYYEADAFARWAKARLPRETEWEVAARDVEVAGNFAESGAFRPLATPVENANETARAPSAMFGDVWEWTQSAYSPYPGYRAADGALGEYNGKFMVNQMVLRGGSCASPRSHLRATYRNFFPPAARWQFSGIRLARDA
jgi:ergothioneine biosynthesis protein EgtB